MEIKDILNKLSLEEKAKLCVGKNFWMTHSIPELSIPSLVMSDGPHGLRKQDLEKGDHLGLTDSLPSVCYPTGSLVACSWDEKLVYQMGDALGKEAYQKDVDILLGPAINIKRSPLCGRNFEYYSEDPYLTGKLAAAFVKGVQNNKVAACPKHFIANNQETRRKSINEIIDDRTLREIYLAAFEMAILEGDAWALMSSYNKVNGKYVAENKHLSQKILREEWGFNGILLTDWGAMDQIGPSIQAGLSLQMPGDNGYASDKIIKLVNNDLLNERDLDRAITNILKVIKKTRNKPENKITPEEFHKLAFKIASESIVLLKNQDKILPIRKNQKIGVIGEMAIYPRYQGSGSSHVNPYKLTNALEELKKYYPDILYADGYKNERASTEQIQKACEIAETCNTLIIFSGLPSSYEAETYDRENMEMPPDHNKLIMALTKINPNIIVVLSCGSPIEMPWKDDVKGIVGLFLAGEAGGEAIAKILVGKINPSGKLTETYPKKLEDNPSYINFPGEGDRVVYHECQFIGYRYYEKKKIKPLFPFGYGLSYTSFEYSKLILDKEEIFDNENLEISFDIENVGTVYGKEIVQLYVKNFDEEIIRPIKELKAFKKVGLKPNETKNVRFSLNKRSFAYFNDKIEDWHVNTNEYEICIGASSDDIRLSKKVKVKSTHDVKTTVTRNTLLRDIFTDTERNEKFYSIYQKIKPYLPFNLDKADLNRDRFAKSLLENMTLNSLASYVGYPLTDEKLREIIEYLNSD